MARCTKHELAARIKTIHGLMTYGAVRATLLQYISEISGWKVSERMAEIYIARATAIFIESGKSDMEYETGLMKERLDMLYRKHTDKKDYNYRDALAVLKERANLLGLNAPKRTEIAGPNGGAIPLRYINDWRNAGEDE